MRAVRTHELNASYRYGSSANLVLTTGHGVNGYTLDAALGDISSALGVVGQQYAQTELSATGIFR